MWLATLTLPLILAAPPTDAEKLLLDMERQLVEAKSLRIKFEIEGKGFQGGAKCRGVLETAPGNLSRTEAEIAFSQEGKKIGSLKLLEISDGAKNHVVRFEMFDDSGKPLEGFTNTQLNDQLSKGPVEISAVSKRFNEGVARMICRRGLVNTHGRVGCFSQGPLQINFDRFDPATRLEWTELKPPVKEKLGARDAIRLEFEYEDSLGTLDLMGKGPVIRKGPKTKCRIWVDAETKLPLRWISGEKDKEVIEDFKAIELNPKVDPSRFVVPKSK